MYFVEILIQAGLLFGSIVAVGLLIHLGEKLFYFIMPGSRAICYMTGLIGTPIHELSHALLCLIFGHKIESIKLYTPNSKDGSLGSVEHSYNKRNFYQLIGNFFIGIAPITVGTLILVGIQSIFSTGYVEQLYTLFSQPSITWDVAWLFVKDSTLCIFSASNINNWVWWVCMLVSMQIALHMGLSGADVAGSWLSALILMIMYMIVAMIVSIFVDVTVITAFVAKIAVMILAVGSLALLMILLWLIMASFVLLVKMLIKK